MKTLAEHIDIYMTQNKGGGLTAKQRRRLFQSYRCRNKKCGAFGAESCMTEGGKKATSRHRVRPA